MDDLRPPTTGFCQQPVWWLVLLVIVFGQAGLTLELFGPSHSIEGLTDSRAIVAGRHPLHLYHATLGADTFRERWGTSCYDPAFQAGYPKTPVFDGGCRPAEAMLVLAGKTTPARAYKFGVFGLCLIVPLIFAASARAVGLAPPGAVLAASVGCILWWSPDVRAMLNTGNVDLLLAGLMGLLFIGGLVRYHTNPGVLGWIKMSAAAIVGWYAQPVVWLGLLPVIAIYYVYLAPKHGLAWHLGLIGITATGLAPNLWWLWDWGRFWWLRQPSVDKVADLPSLSRLVGSVSEYTELIGTQPVGWAVFVAGFLGLVAMARNGQTVASIVMLVAAGLAVIVARLGETWPTLQIVAADRIAPFAVAVLTPAAAYLLWSWWSIVQQGRAAVIAVALFPVFLGWAGPVAAPVRSLLGVNVAPLPLGLTAEQESLIAGVRTLTTPDARILIEETDPTHPGWNWTALLPERTERAFLGGLDPEACVEHAWCGLRNNRLNGRSFADWTGSERDSFCQRYNIGWVLCRSAEAADWWKEMPGAKVIGEFSAAGYFALIELERPKSFVLTGTATIERINRDGIVLVDAVPDESGTIVLSLHHQPGFRAAPGVVRIDTAPDPYDPIPFLKLHLPGPISRISLTWENP